MKAEDMFIALSEQGSLDMANTMLALFYIPDLTIDRAEICRVSRMLENHFARTKIHDQTI
jgi:hypothetical protein